MNKLFIGIEIGGTKLQIAIGNQNADIIEHYRKPVEKNKGAEGIRNNIEKIVKQILKKYKILSIGVGFGGPIDIQTGKVILSYQIKNWENFNLKNWLQEITHLPVTVENDANTAALGESLKGCGKDYKIVFYTTLGSGVGGGLIINGNIYHGAKPGESEIGHIRLNKKGTIVEDECSGWAVDKKIRTYINKHPKSTLAKIVGENKHEAKYLIYALKQKDKAAQKILTNTAKNLAFGLSHVVQLFHPEVIILGGGLSLIGEPLRKYVSKYLPKFIMKSFLPGPDIKIASLKENVVCIGALYLAMKNIKLKNKN